MLKKINKYYKKMCIYSELNRRPIYNIKRTINELVMLSNRTHRLQEIYYYVTSVKLIKSIVPYWEEYSGSKVSPVKSYVKGVSPSTAVTQYYLWDTTTDYGKARIRLVNWLIETLSEYVAHTKREY